MIQTISILLISLLMALPQTKSEFGSQVEKALSDNNVEDSYKRIYRTGKIDLKNEDGDKLMAIYNMMESKDSSYRAYHKGARCSHHTISQIIETHYFDAKEWPQRIRNRSFR